MMCYNFEAYFITIYGMLEQCGSNENNGVVHMKKIRLKSKVNKIHLWRDFLRE